MNDTVKTLDPGKVFTTKEAATVLAQLPQENRTLRIAVRLGLSAGLRISEIVALRLDDVHLDRAQLYIRNGKGGRSRSVMIPASLVDALRQWIDHDRPETDAPQVVVSCRSSHWGRPIGVRTLFRTFKRMLTRAGLPADRISRLSPHSMRHYYATRCLELGKTLPWVQRQLGHANLTTTAVYLGVASVEGNGPVEVV